MQVFLLFYDTDKVTRELAGVYSTGTHALAGADDLINEGKYLRFGMTNMFIEAHALDEPDVRTEVLWRKESKWKKN